MFRNFFESLKIELTGMGQEVKVGIPHKPNGDDGNQGEDITIYLTFVNIERIERQAGRAVIRILITAFIKESKLVTEEAQLDAFQAIDEIIGYLEENRRSYTLVPTPENMTNNIWSAFRIPLRPFLVYECPVSLSN